MKINKFILIGFMVMAYMFVSNDDYQVQVQEDEYWCQMIEEGTWYASQDEIAKRCPE